MEPTSAAPQPPSNYDFILSPEKNQKRKILGGVGGDKFATKIIFIVGGAVTVMVVLAVVVNLLFGSKTNLETLVSLAQTEQEIARLGGVGGDAGSQTIKNSAINTQLVITSHRASWLTFLSKRGREVKKEELNLKKDATADKKLETAKQTSTFDTTYNTLMRSELVSYASSLKGAYQGASNKQERQMLNTHYDDIQLLLKQWPSS